MLSYRKFDKESDYNIMRHIVQHNCLQTGHLYPQLHIGNLDFARYAFEESPDILYKTTWLVSDSKTEIGFITASEDEFYITVRSDFEHLTQEIMNYIELNCYTDGDILIIDANSENKFLSGILEQRGYSQTDNFGYRGICDLSEISSSSPLIEGFNIRLSQKKDVARRVELFGLPTGGIGTTSEKYEKMMNSISYCDAIDLVVETDNEEIVAYCTVWDDPVSKTAVLEPVACVAEHRRKGIMKSTLLYVMNLVKVNGTKYIYVGTGGENIASQALYKSVGFLEYGSLCEWQKTI
jgi:predicted GNAT family acetyltransferase